MTISQYTGKMLPTTKEVLRDKSASLRKRWYSLRHRETMLWLCSSGDGFVADRRYGWRGTKDQMICLQGRGGDAEGCLPVDVTTSVKGSPAPHYK